MIRSGDHAAIVGANGSGKSSLLRVLTGEVWPSPGVGSRRFSLDGVETASPLLIRPRMRRVAPEMQERFLRLALPLSVFEFVASGFSDRDYATVALSNDEQQRVVAMLARMQLQHLAAKEARSLSHGTLRRAFVARALLIAPALLALDEVTDGLDAHSRELVITLLDLAVEQGTTLVCVAHRIERLPACVRTFYALREGRLYAITRPAFPDPPSDGAVRPATQMPAGAASALIDLVHVNVCIDGTPVLFDITYTLRKGEHVAIVGPNGAGKSTLAGVIDGTYLPSSGRVIRHGYAVRPSVWELKRRIVTLSDALQLRHDWLRSVRDTIASGFSAAIGTVCDLDARQRQRVDALLDRFALNDLAERWLPELSFGQRRRALLARAMLHDAEVFILDEIFDGLDPGVRAMLDRELEQAAHAGTTLICITHVEADVPPYIWRRIALANGRITPADYRA